MATEICSSISTNESESNMLQQEASSSSISKQRGGFGKFLVAAADILDLKCARRIGVFFNLGESHTEDLKCSDDPGLDLLTTMRSMDLISPTDIDQLVDCLQKMDLSGTAKSMQTLFKENGCGKITSLQDVRSLQAGLTTEDSNYFSSRKSSHKDCKTSENPTSSGSSRKRKKGKWNAPRLTLCSGDEYVYVVREVEEKGNGKVISPEHMDEATEDKADGGCRSEDDDMKEKLQDDEDEDEEEEEEGEVGELVAVALEGDNQTLKTIYMEKGRLRRKIETGQIYKIRGHLANENSIVLTTSTKIMKSGEDELFQGIKPETSDHALTALRKSHREINLPILEVKSVKYELSEKMVVNYLTVVVTKIALHVAFFKGSFERKAHVTVADSEKDRLTVIFHDKNVSSLRLREGSIIKLLNFETYKGQRSFYYDNSNCLVSRRGSQIKLILNKQLQKLKDLLPLTGSYQMEGTVVLVNHDLDTYDACPRPECYEKGVEMTKKDYYYCKKCGEEYTKSKILEGFWLELTVKNENSKEYIIFKNTVICTLSELSNESVDSSNDELHDAFEKNFLKKVIRMVVKPSDGQNNDVITSLQVLQ